MGQHEPSAPLGHLECNKACRLVFRGIHESNDGKGACITALSGFLCVTRAIYHGTFWWIENSA
jgi:hypothetical protein